MPAFDVLPTFLRSKAWGGWGGAGEGREEGESSVSRELFQESDADGFFLTTQSNFYVFSILVS